jgi:hypothetical protein
MNKGIKIALVVGAAAIAAWLAWRWYQQRQASTPGGGQLGTNLNSIAPFLVGGSSGPTAQPAVNVPVNINYTESSPAPLPETPDSDDMMIPANATSSYGGSSNALTQQSDAAGQTSDISGAAADQTTGTDMGALMDQQSQQGY